MSDFDDEYEGDEETGPKALRAAMKKLQAEVKALREENAGLKTETRKTTVASVLKSKGLPEKLAALYQGEPDEAAVTAWAEEYADVFGLQKSEPEAEAESEHTSDEVRQQYAAMGRVQSTSSIPAEGLAKVAQQLDAATSAEDVLAALNLPLGR